MADKQKVIEIKTGDSIKNIQDLKNNIKALKENLATLDIGTAAYKETLNELQENQAALRNAMHGTSADFKDVMDAATAANVAFDENNNAICIFLTCKHNNFRLSSNLCISARLLITSPASLTSHCFIIVI